MKKILIPVCLAAFVFACQKDEEVPTISKNNTTGDATLFLAPNVAGEFYSSSFINQAHNNFGKHNKELANTMLLSANNEERKGKYFSREMLEQLLKLKDMKGIVVKYGLVYEDTDNKVVSDFDSQQDYKNLKMRLFVVPYDKNDKILPFSAKNARVSDEGGGGAGNGKPIPPYGQ